MVFVGSGVRKVSYFGGTEWGIEGGELGGGGGEGDLGGGAGGGEGGVPMVMLIRGD